MYPLHEMDFRYIIQSIETCSNYTESFKELLFSTIKNEENLITYEKDFIILAIKYNFKLSDSYKEMLIYKIKEG